MNDTELNAGLKQFIGLPAREFVLHREPMLLLDRLVDIGAEFASCEWIVGDSAFAGVCQHIPAYTGVEYMAQCIAVHAGAHARLRGEEPPLGFLLGSRHFRTSLSAFETGRTFVSTCREIVRDSQGMASFACELRLDDECVATANLAVFEQRKYIA